MTRLPELDAAFSRAAEAATVPGIVAMAVLADGGRYEAAFGKRALPAGAVMTLDSVFWIASMTKAITSAAAMQLVERGKLDLEAPIAAVLPELAAPQVLEGFDAAGAPRLRPARRPITLRQLLTHTAGFGYDIWSADLVRYQAGKDIPGIIACQKRSLGNPLLFDPGEKWEYGINIDWVGQAVERASGQDLETYLREHLFAPLGMADTGFRLSADRRRRLVGMHARQPNGALEPIPFEVPQEPEFFMGGGGLYGTAGDYLKFQQVFLNGGGGVLKPETVAAMSRNQMGALNVRKVVTAIPGASNDAEFFPGMVKKWSFGFMLNTEPAPGGGRSAGSLAWAGLGNTYYWIDPARRVAGVILAQLLPFADATVLDLFGQFERAVYAAA